MNQTFVSLPRNGGRKFAERRMMMNTYCDKCHFEWDIKETDIESIELNGDAGVKMRYFACPECGQEYIVDVTDRELRKQISIYKKMVNKYGRMFAKHESEVRLRNYQARMDRVRKENLARQEELRKKWCYGR